MKALKDSIILVTKKSDEVKSSFEHLEKLCRKIIFLPTIKIVPTLNSNDDQLIRNRINEYDYLIFTSANAVKVFLDYYKNIIDFDKVKVVAIGKSTAKKCKDYGINVEIIPDTFSANGLLNIFKEENIHEKNILIPGSAISRNELRDELQRFGANVDFIPIYDVQINHDYKKELDEIKNNQPDIFAFTSPSSFHNFLKLMNIAEPSDYFFQKTICAIGNTTEEAITKYGLNVNVVPQNFSIEHLVDALIKFYELQKNIA